ncbi:MAG: FAD-linked oxidase C-terminal domain-containing protein [Balneolaceae bacterium]
MPSTTFPTIQTDLLTRRLYANDASMYEEVPEGVSFPRSAGEIRELVRASADQGFVITARSGGTSLAGQATGGGVVMDVSRHMTEILTLDPQKRIARVQPGVIRDQLNAAAKQYELQFGPDTSTTNRCMIGGMIGNNSCGSFSIKHGTTREHTVSVETILSDGSIAHFHPLSSAELEEKCREQTLEGKIYRGMLRLLRENRERIEASYPHPEIIRRNTGYALDRLCEMDPITPGGRPFNLSELLCGSEGTLAMTTAATVQLVPLEREKLLVIPQFETLSEALKAAVDAVELAPSAVELVDRIILDATKGNLEQKRNRFFLEREPEALLIVQFEGSDPNELNRKGEELIKRLNSRGLGYTAPMIRDREKMERVWELRKAGLGLLMGLGADSRSPTFVEDTAVRVQDLPAYVEEFEAIQKRYGTRCVYYAHASTGELHLRPVIDITKPEGRETMKAMAEEVARLVRKYRGSLSGEHGDGRARAPYIEQVLGSEMMPLLRSVKELWDPEYRFNPGKILDPKPIDSNLRFPVPYRPIEVETVFGWREERGFGAALEQCNGAGVCRKRAESGGAMCPSYHVTLEEMDSTRGRANLFRQIFISQGQQAFGSEDIKEGLKLCLSCKACKSECPANVDMAKMKAEFLHGWHRKYGASLADRFFGEPERFYPMASLFNPVVNVLNETRAVRYLMEKLAGIDSQRTLPRFAPEPFRKWFSANRAGYQTGQRKKIALLVDLFTNYHEPEIAIAACRVLSRLGYDVLIPDVKTTGRPQISRGLLGRAKQIAQENLNLLSPLVQSGIPIIGLEPSELLTLRDEFPDLCSSDNLERGKSVAANSYLLEEFLSDHFANHPEHRSMFNGAGKKVQVHGHCHTKALVGTEPLLDVLNAAGFEPEDLNTGCCGMAGSFGYEKENRDVSMKIGELNLFPAVRSADTTLVCAPGFSCRHQIRDGTGIAALHPVQLLENVLLSPVDA